MDLSKVLSIGGKPGLYEVVGQMKNGVLVESMTDGKRFPAYPHHQLSLLSEISIYGTERDIPLDEVMQSIYAYRKGELMEVPKNNEEIMDLFCLMLEEVDEDRVYPSDAKKVFKWYNDLLKKGLIEEESDSSQESSQRSAEEEE